MYNDLREWIKEAETIGKLRYISGAHWEREIAALAELIRQKKKDQTPLLLFDEIPGYKKGYRVAFHQLIAPWQIALTMDLPYEYESILDLAKTVYQKIKDLKTFPPKVVQTGPILENVHLENELNLLEFPVLRFSEFDGGRYIGTSDCVIMKDPDEGWINVGTYRVQLHDEKSAGLYISPGKQGAIIRQKYFDRDIPCPVAVCLGVDPLFLLCAGSEIPYGVSEFDYAGGIRGAPVEVVEGPETGLPIPAMAEIAIEGYCFSDHRMPEGPFPEWTGYYGSSTMPQPVIRVKSILHRNDPILTARCSMRGENFDFNCLIRSALLWKEIENAGVRNVRGVWRYQQAGSRFFNVISIKQEYYGHARQALYVSAQTAAGAYAGRWVVVVDEDIDPSNIDEVLWAMGTRCNPTTDIEFINRSRSTPLDPMCFDKSKNFYTSIALVDACIPFEEKENFPKSTGIPLNYREEITKKWDKLFEEL
jgi:4-hydroxy-3-polyprenylbenzoate decarboxylase